MPHVCPWWHAYSFDHIGRRLFHKPEVILADYVEKGMTVLDVGCGMGFFSIGMAGMVGESGRVIAVDVQHKMLEKLVKRARRARVNDRIITRLCEPDDLGVTEKVDFVLCFWVVHETPDAQRFLSQVRSCLKPSAKCLVVEPKLHVSRRRFQEMLDVVESAGLSVCAYPKIRLSRSALLEAGS